MALIGLGTACPVALAQGLGVATPGAEDVPFARTEGPRETFGSFLRSKDELGMPVIVQGPGSLGRPIEPQYDTQT